MAVEADSLSKRHEEDFARFKRSVRRSPLKPVIVLLGLALLLYFFLAPRATLEEIEDLHIARRALLAVPASWATDLAETHASGQRWLSAHGMPSEVRAYDFISQKIFRVALACATFYDQTGVRGFISRTLTPIFNPLLRVSFVLIACWRIWLAAVLLALLWEALRTRAYRAQDLLGQTGNDRLFFSGIRTSLTDLSHDGTPNLHVRGLACPAAVSTALAKASPLADVLERFQASNDTNLALTAVILKHADMPAYAPGYGESDAINQFHSGAGLAENTTLILEKALTLHAHYRGGERAALPAKPHADTAALSDASLLPVAKTKQVKVDKHDYAAMLQQAMHRVLTPEMKAELAQIPPKELAATILAYEAGKVLAYAKEQDRWIRKSSFPQLSARAVLHSIASYGHDFDTISRRLMRRALVYGSRRSVFGPVRFPLDLSSQTRALRQWVELLIADPHELESVTDEVELVGLVTQAYQSWHERFFDAILDNDKGVLDGIIASPLNMIFVPAVTIIKLMHSVTNLDRRNRLTQLVAQVSQRQKARLAKTSSPEDESYEVPDYERILAPPSQDQIKSLAAMHAMAIEQVRDWMSYRVILNAHAWLGKRVGDATIREDCLVFAVFQSDFEMEGKNSLGLWGRPGMVAMRASALAEKFGPDWASRFPQAGSVWIAQNKEDYENLLRGIRDTASDDMSDQSFGPT